jgi:hypothetical protein
MSNSNKLKLNINKVVIEKYGALSPEIAFLSELYKKVSEAEQIPDRRPFYSIEVTDNFDLNNNRNKHWRWAGNLDQFEKDCREYCEASEGDYIFVTKNHIEWRSKAKFGERQQVINFRAVK